MDTSFKPAMSGQYAPSRAVAAARPVAGRAGKFPPDGDGPDEYTTQSMTREGDHAVPPLLRQRAHHASQPRMSLFRR